MDDGPWESVHILVPDDPEALEAFMRLEDVSTGQPVQVPGEAETWVILHHFLWEKGPEFFGTDSLEVWPAYQIEARGWAKGSDVTGRLLYDRDGQAYTAPYYFLGEATAVDTGALSMLLGTTQQTNLYAGFSLPREGENRRGYLAYTIFDAGDAFSINSHFSYMHQHTWFQYPATTALQAELSSPGTIFIGPFAKEMTWLDFAPSIDRLQLSD